MLPLLAAEAKERQRESGGDRKSEDYQKSVVPKSAQPIEPNTRANAIAAKSVGIGTNTVTQMKRVTEVSPELAEEVKKGQGCYYDNQSGSNQ